MASRSPDEDVVHRVVVGVDESPPAQHALNWTARAFAPGATIHAVNVVSPALELAVAAVQMDSTGLLERNRRDLEESWTAAARMAGADITCHVVENTEARALTQVADQTDAELIIVGTKGHVRRVPRTLGNTVRELLAVHARQPIVIVPDGSDLALSGSVVVGVSDTEQVGPALRWAAEFASARRLSLCLVGAGPRRRLFSLDGLIERIAYSIDRDVVRTWALEDLAELAAQIRSSTDDELQISWSVPDGRRRPRIVEASADTALLVLEGRAHERADDSSWIHDRIKHAPCPVVVFQAADEPAADDR